MIPTPTPIISVSPETTAQIHYFLLQLIEYGLSAFAIAFVILFLVSSKVREFAGEVIELVFKRKI